LAQQIDTKMLDVKADADMAVGRYNSIQDNIANQGSIVAGAETALVNANSSYTVIQPGIYITTALFSLSATTVTSVRLRVKKNAAQVYGRTYSLPDAPASAAPLVVPGAPIVCAAGDVLSTTILFTGTGAGTASLRLGVRMIVRIP
jgi:hypothetical protein